MTRTFLNKTSSFSGVKLRFKDISRIKTMEFSFHFKKHWKEKVEYSKFSILNYCCFSECGGGVKDIYKTSIELTVATVFTALALLASCLSVMSTLLFCKYRWGQGQIRIMVKLDLISTKRFINFHQDKTEAWNFKYYEILKDSNRRASVILNSQLQQKTDWLWKHLITDPSDLQNSMNKYPFL